MGVDYCTDAVAELEVASSLSFAAGGGLSLAGSAGSASGVEEAVASGVDELTDFGGVGAAEGLKTAMNWDWVYGHACQPTLGKKRAPATWAGA